MFNRIDASKSTKGASKLRRDLINAEIANLRDLLPLPPSTRQRLSQLQLMALVCVFLRKANYFQQALKNCPSDSSNIPTPNIGFSKAMSGFIMMMTQQGKLLYISENAAEYLGHSMEDLLIHGDSVYDVIDKQDHMVVQNQLARNSPVPSDRRLFLCRINVSRNSRRQLRFGDQKVVLVEGHFLPFVPVCNRNEFVFLASCTPVVLPETRESIVQGATNIFTTIHSMDMKYLHIDKTAESHLEYSRAELINVSWYNLLHWDSIRTAYCKHQTVIQSDQERSATALLRLQSRSGRWFWVHCVLQVKDTSEECQHPIIVCTNQVLSDREAEVMRSSSWLYQYSSQSKFTYTICSGGQNRNVPYTQNNQQDYSRSSSHGHTNEARHSPIMRSAEQDLHSGSKGQLKEYGTRSTREDAEPVDMSISSVEHEGRSPQIQGQHSHYILGQFTDRYHKVHQKSSLGLTGYRAKFVQCHGQYSVDALSPKYYITDLDKDYCCAERSIPHKRLPTKVLPAISAVGSATESTETSVEHWNSSPVWSDTLQRVPDVVHQDLSPYVATPTTPVDTPDSELQPETPIFNFDWGTEQHVPNLKITFRSSNHPSRKAQEVQPITLQLPRRKGQSTNDSKDFPKFTSMTFRTGRTILTVLKSITNNNATTVHFVSPRYIYTGVERFAERRKQISTGLMVHGFQNVKNKHKENFLTILHSYKSKIKEHQGCVDFIKTALKYMEEFGVHQDLETYKKLTEVMPKGKYVPLNLLQAMFQHYPLQQQTIVDLLDQMEYFGVMPDREMEDILLNIFGCQALPLRKYWRMMYWMPKFRHVNPWLLNDTILADPREMAKFALQKMTIADPSTKISMFDAKEIPDSIEDTWVASAISPVQEELLGALPETETLFVEGPYKVWIANHTIDYLVLRGEVINRSVIEIDEDDISNIQIPYHELKKVAVQYSIHEQTDGTYYAMCVSGTSSKDSALSWIRYLQNTNPILKKVAVVFKLKSSTGDEIVDQSNGTIQSKKQSEKKEGATER